MNISLTPELEQMVNDKVRGGMYQTASEVVREGLRLLRERDQRMEAMRQDIRAGFDAVARGKYTDYDEASIGELTSRVKERGMKRLAAAQKKSGSR